MLLIEVDGIEKKIPKNSCVFEFDDCGRKDRVVGSEIQFRPEDRVKKVK